MNRTDLDRAVQERIPQAKPEFLAAVITALLETVEDALVGGEEVKLRHFGTFYAGSRAASSTPVAAVVPAQRVARFRPARRLRTRLAPLP